MDECKPLVRGGAYGPWPGDADANVATALALGAAQVAAATVGWCRLTL